MPITTSPDCTRSAPRTMSASTTPVAAPATSYSSTASRPGCSAVSPPTSAVSARRQPSATPRTMSAMRSGTTLPHAM